MTGCRFAGLIAILMSVSASVADELAPELSVKEIMNSIVTPATNTIWGAYQLETESQWQEVGRAATAVIGAANLLANALYAVYVRYIINTIKPSTIDLVYYNNLLSLPLLAGEKLVRLVTRSFHSGVLTDAGRVLLFK